VRKQPTNLLDQILTLAIVIEADTNTALSLLLHYPAPSASHPPRSFIKDALFLKKHLTPDGGNHIVTTYTNRPLPLVSRVDLPPTRPQPQTRISGRSAHRIITPAAPSHRKTPSGGLENLIQDAARGVYSQGEKWGFNKAVREAAVSVRKNITDLQSTQSSPRIKLPGFLVTTPSRTSEETVFTKADALEQRNKTLAKMLEKAVGELWDFQKERSETETEASRKDALEKLSVAVATVQLVQVYLDDSSIPLPSEEDERKSIDSSRSATPQTPVFRSTVSPARQSASESERPQRAQTPSGSSIDTSTAPIRQREARSAARSSVSTAPSGVEPNPDLGSASEKPESLSSASNKSTLSRPALAQSSFSWMLGQDENDKSARENFRASSRYVSSSNVGSAGAVSKEDRRKGKGFLFGDEEWELEGT